MLCITLSFNHNPVPELPKGTKTWTLPMPDVIWRLISTTKRTPINQCHHLISINGECLSNGKYIRPGANTQRVLNIHVSIGQIKTPSHILQP